MSILLVEGSMEERFHMRLLLRQNGHKDITATQSGRGAKRLLQHGEVNIGTLDLVIVNMNDDGVELCDYLFERPGFGQVPVLAVVQSDSSAMASALASGATDVIVHPWSDLEFTTRVRMQLKVKHQLDSLRSGKKHLIEVSHQLREANQMLQKLSALDGLTGITNRRAFDEMLSSEWKRAQREGQPVGLVLLDIDFFKVFNDNEGHQAGDQCLVQIAHTLKSCLRRAGDVVGRWGGEEFGVLLPNTGLEGAAAVGESMRRAVEALQIPQKTGSVITVSGGAASLEPALQGGGTEQLLAMADEALYLAKRSGRNQIKRQQFFGAHAPKTAAIATSHNEPQRSSPFDMVHDRIQRLEKIVETLASENDNSLGSLSEEELKALLGAELGSGETEIVEKPVREGWTDSPNAMNGSISLHSTEPWTQLFDDLPYVFVEVGADRRIRAAHRIFESASDSETFLALWQSEDQGAVSSVLGVHDGCITVEARFGATDEWYCLHGIYWNGQHVVIGHSVQELREAKDKLQLRERLLRELACLT